MNQVIEQCENCGAEGQAYGLVNGKLICSICHKPMIEDKPMPSNAPEALPESLTGTKTAIVGLSLSEMLENVNKARKEFEALESRLNKIRQQKLNAVADDAREKVVSLSKEDADLSQKLDAAYQLWQVAKRNYEGALSDKENIIIAQGLLSDYNETSISIRAEKGNVFLNHVRQLNDLIVLVSDMSAEFEGVQTKGMVSMEMLCNKLKSMNVWHIEDTGGNTIEIPVIKNDCYGSIRPIREGLNKEAGLLETSLSLLEKTVVKIRKACNFHLLQRGD